MVNRNARIAELAGKLSVEKIAGVDWQCRYQVYTTQIAGWLPIQFEWTSEGYKITIAGLLIKHRAKDVNEAAAKAVEAAGIWVSRAGKFLTELPK